MEESRCRILESSTVLEMFLLLDTPTLQEPFRGERVNFSLQSFHITAHPCGEVKSKELGCSRHIHIQEESEMFACSLACLQPDFLTP